MKLNNDPYDHLGESHLLTALSQGVQLLNYSANTMFDVTAYDGDSDLANALVNSIYTVGGGRALYNANVELGGDLSEDVQNGEQYYGKIERDLLPPNSSAAKHQPHPEH